MRHQYVENIKVWGQTTLQIANRTNLLGEDSNLLIIDARF